ncbi:MAG: hypothetical protein OIF55_15960 [Amphritea sp.]|nr:hypothetical protein [Amphritea sp.]
MLIIIICNNINLARKWLAEHSHLTGVLSGGSRLIWPGASPDFGPITNLLQQVVVPASGNRLLSLLMPGISPAFFRLQKITDRSFPEFSDISLKKLLLIIIICNTINLARKWLAEHSHLTGVLSGGSCLIWPGTSPDFGPITNLLQQVVVPALATGSCHYLCRGSPRLFLFSPANAHLRWPPVAIFKAWIQLNHQRLTKNRLFYEKGIANHYYLQ